MAPNTDSGFAKQVTFAILQCQKPDKIEDENPMPAFIHRFLLFCCLFLFSSSHAKNIRSSHPLSIQVYATAGQVTHLLGTPEKRAQALKVLQLFHVDKIYLEAIRGDDRPEEKVLLESRDFFRTHGLQVATGITTIPGQTFGQPTNGDKYRLNYESPKTQEDMKKAFQYMASHFDEILIDDFFCTDDTSKISVDARGDRTWEEYRQELMPWVGRELAVKPAKKTNPKVRVLSKFPQWYDRFHLFGWNPVEAPKVFDGIWVGAETRNPRTQRFGFVQPTEGYVNFSWLRTLGGTKVTGAWFDALDGHSDVFLMQAYQSILADANNLILFHLGELVQDNPITHKFRSRVDSLLQFAQQVEGLPRQGVFAYKPAHSPSGEDLFLYDFLTVLGIPLTPTGNPPQRPASLILATQAAADPNIHRYVRAWLQSGATLLVTPGFLENMDASTLTLLVGNSDSLGKRFETFSTEQIWVGEERELLTTASDFIALPHLSSEWETFVHGMHLGKQVPILAQRIAPKGGSVVLLNVKTFSRDEFGPGKEMYLSPRQLGIPDWPRSFAAAIQGCLPSAIPFHIEGTPPYSVHALGPEHFAVCSFTEKNQTLNFKQKIQQQPNRLSVLHDSLDRELGELVQARLECGGYQTILPAWEVMVFQARQPSE